MQPCAISSTEFLGEALIVKRIIAFLLLATTATVGAFGCRTFSPGHAVAQQQVLELAVEPGFLEVPWRAQIFADGRVVQEIGTTDIRFDKRKLPDLTREYLQNLMRILEQGDIFRQPSEHPDAGDRPVLIIRLREGNFVRERFVVSACPGQIVGDPQFQSIWLEAIKAVPAPVRKKYGDWYYFDGVCERPLRR